MEAERIAGRFAATAPIGRGNSGEVYQASGGLADGEVVVKLIHRNRNGDTVKVFQATKNVVRPDREVTPACFVPAGRSRSVGSRALASTALIAYRAGSAATPRLTFVGTNYLRPHPDPGPC